MRSLIGTVVAAFAVMALAPAVAQDAAPAIDAMTCGEFLALGEAEQGDAMLALRASYNGEALPEPSTEPDASTNAEDAGGGDEAEAEEAEEGEEEPEGSHRLTGMRTACEGVPDALALDALVAAHADYDE